MNTPVFAAVDDIFFASKIRATAEQLGISIGIARTRETLTKLCHEARPRLVIIDLHAQQFDPLEVARQLKGDLGLRDVPLVGFFSHVQTELQRRAIEAGIEHVLPRSAFTKRLPDILQGRF